MALFNSLAQQAGESGSSVMPVGLVDQNGNALSSNTNGQNTMANSAPVVLPSDQASIPTEGNISNLIRAGKGYVVTTGTNTTSVSPYMALELFNPNASGKTIYVWRAIGQYSVAISSRPSFFLYTETTDPSLAWTSPAAITPTPLKIAGTASVATSNQTSVANHGSLVGTQVSAFDTAADVTGEFLQNMNGILVPANNGVALYINSQNTTQYSMSIWYVEY